MNRRLRVLLVGRHFWPHGSIDSAAFLYQLAIGLHRSGVHTEVLSPRFASSWPEELILQEIPVHRPVTAPRSDWSIGRYGRHLTNWLRDHAGSFDVILVDSIREESTCVIEAARAIACRSIVRFAGWGESGDSTWWQNSRAGRRCANVGKTADKAISKCAASHRALIAEGYVPSRIERIDQGFVAGELRTAMSRQTARQTLASVNRDLMAEADAPVLVCVGQMTRQSGMNLLVESARHLVARYPDLRIWFIGDGPHREAMHETLRSDGVRASIAMPGSFCDTTDLLAAADVFVQTDEEGLDFSLPAAISAELSVVAVDRESTRTVVGGPAPSATEAHSLVQWYVPDSGKTLRTSLRQVLGDLPGHREKASMLRKLLLRTRPQSQTIDSYVRLIRDVAQQNPDPSIGTVS